MSLVNQINSQSAVPYGLTVVKIPGLAEVRWQKISEDQVPEDISNKIESIKEGFKLTEKYRMELYPAYNMAVVSRKELIGSKWEQAIYDAGPDKANVRFGVYDNHHKFSEEKDNFFLDQGSGNNSNWHRVPARYEGIKSIAGVMLAPEVIERLTNKLDPVSRNNTGLAAVYSNNLIQSNCYVFFDPREGDLELEFTKEGLQKGSMR